MRNLRTSSLLILGSIVASAQAAPTIGPRVRVLGNVMASQVVTRVAPVYPATARKQGISGEVVLYAEVGADGRVEDAAYVRGPQVLGIAAITAVKQWQYKPYLVNGQPVEVDTTVVVDFSQGIDDARAVSTPVSHPVSRRTSVMMASTAQSPVGSVDWESDRRMGEQPMAAAVVRPANSQPVAGRMVPATTPSASVMASKATVTKPSTQPALAGVMASSVSGPPSAPLVGGEAIQAGAPPAAMTRRAVAAMAAPPAASVMTSGAKMSTTPSSSSILTRQAALPPLTPDTNGVVRQEVYSGRTEWHLVKKVDPVYPAEASATGVEGVVTVDALVRKNGTVKPLSVLSGPEQLRQAAMDAVSQYEYAPAVRTGSLSEARTQIAVEFMPMGPADVSAEVMAGYLEHSFTPEYPPAALAAGVGGFVTLHVLISRQGQVENVTPISGPLVLQSAAADAVKSWRYRPFLRAGVDTEVETEVLVHFSIPRH